MSAIGVVLLMVSAFLYHAMRRPTMFKMVRPYVIAANLLTLVWFVLL